MKKRLRWALPVVVVLGVFAALLWYGDAPRIVATVARFQPIYLVWFVCLRLVHEGLRATLWVILLKALAVDVPLQTKLFAFASAEAVNAVPGGAYLENAVLQRAAHSGFGRSSAATTFMVLGEIAVGLLGVVALGVGAWSVWLRLAIVIVAAIAALAAMIRLAAPGLARLPGRVRERPLVKRVLVELGRFREGVAVLTRPSIVAVTLLLGALYVIVSGCALYLVLHALGIGGVSYGQALAATCFGLAFYAVLGSLEAAEVGVLIGMGLEKSAAVSAVLLNRALDVCTTVLLALATMSILRDQWRALGRGQDTGTAERG